MKPDQQPRTGQHYDGDAVPNNGRGLAMHARTGGHLAPAKFFIISPEDGNERTTGPHHISVARIGMNSGINGAGTMLALAAAVPAPEVRSTPSGTTGAGTRRGWRRSRAYVKTVLNAVRHHGGGNAVREMDGRRRPARLCSTPSGITGAGTRAD